MYLRKCKQCGKITKIHNKHGKYCEDCAEMKESLRIAKIMIIKYGRLQVTWKQKYNMLLARQEENNGIKQN